VTKTASKEYIDFEEALGKVLQVSHDEMKKKLEEEKKAKASKPRPSSSDPVSDDKD